MPLVPTRYYSARALKPVWKPEDCSEVQASLPASITYTKGQILGEIVGVDATQTLTITGTPTGGTFTLTFGGVATAGIPFNATAAQTQSALNAISTLASNNIQKITITGSPTGGSFIIGLVDQLTTAIAWNASAATVAAALAALPNVGGSGNVSVSGSAGGPWTITFQGQLAGVTFPLMSINSLGLTGGTNPVATPTMINNGGGNSLNVSVTGTQMPGGSQVITFQNVFGKQPITALTPNSAGLTGGSSPTAVITAGTTGVLGTGGAYTAYALSNTDGSQVAKAILQYDVTTDSAGNITLGFQSGGGPWSETFLTVPAYVRGYFSIEELVGLTNQACSDMGRIVRGSLAAGGVLRVF